jgi:hypothetical protein
MTREEKIEVLERIHHLIRRRGTGKPCELAKRLQLSERTIYNLISEMKLMNAPIFYCNERNSYCYEFEVEFVIGFVKKEFLTKISEDLKKITGGKSTYENIFEKKYSLKEFL